MPFTPKKPRDHVKKAFTSHGRKSEYHFRSITRKGRYTLGDMSLQHVTNVAATRRGDKPLLVYRSGDKLLQQLILVILSPQQVAENQTSLNLCD